MSSQPFVAGPCPIYVGLPSGSPKFLGITKNTPVIKVKRNNTELWNDLAGQKKPLEIPYAGKEGLLGFDFTVYDEQVLQWIQAYPASEEQITGRDNFGVLGTLPILEGAAFRVWVVLPYATRKAAMARMPNGYRFLACHPVGEEDFGALNTTTRSAQLAFHALPVIQSNGDHILYDADTTGLPDATFGVS